MLGNLRELVEDARKRADTFLKEVKSLNSLLTEVRDLLKEQNKLLDKKAEKL